MGRPRKILTEEEKLVKKKAKEKDKEENERGLNRAKWMAKHPEDQWLDDENQMARRRGYDDDDIRSLFAAICLKACIDYRKAVDGCWVDGKEPSITVEECREFFGDEMFQLFVNRIPVPEIEKVIRSTPRASIHTLWRKSEDHQVAKKIV